MGRCDVSRGNVEFRTSPAPRTLLGETHTESSPHLLARPFLVPPRGPRPSPNSGGSSSSRVGWMPPAPHRVAVIDIGSNSTRLLVADVEEGRVTPIERRSTVTRLGRGVDLSGRLAAEAIEATCGAVDPYMATLQELGAERVDAIATSAVRDAANGSAFVAELRERFALSARVLGGDEEARLTYLGATSEHSPDGSRPLVIDIGGGSTELIVGEGRDDRVARLAAGGRRPPHRAPPGLRPADPGRAGSAGHRPARADRGGDARRRRAARPGSRWPGRRPRWRRSSWSSSPTTRNGSTATCSSCRRSSAMLSRLASAPLAAAHTRSAACTPTAPRRSSPASSPWSR